MVAGKEWKFVGFGVVNGNCLHKSILAKIVNQKEESGRPACRQAGNMSLLELLSIETRAGIEPAMGVLQTPALPLGYRVLGVIISGLGQKTQRERLEKRFQ